MKRSVISLGAGLLAASLALTACGTRGGETEPGTGGGNDKTVKIGVISPLSGDLSALGLGIQHSVELAVKQANESGDFDGWNIEVTAADDEGKPEVGKNAATQLAADPEVIGVVGTLNSSVAQTVQPVLASAGIAMVSPANTSPTLTRGAEPETAPKRTYENYFRTCTTDNIQGPFAARYLFETAGIKKVATIHDKKTYGQGLAEAFTKEFEKLGGEIVAAETINPDDAKFTAVLSSIKPSKPEAIYYGGEYPEGAPLSQQAKSAGLKIPVMGGDGMYSADYIKLNQSADGDLATSVGAPIAKLPAGAEFIEAYEAEGYAEAYEAYGAYAYDAATAILEAMKESTADAEDAESAREGTIAALGSVEFDGVTGKVAFDEYGDNTTRVLTTYQVKDGAWTDVFTEEFK